ncbi:T-cell surface glycoprotein CD4-like isoform X2 [Protopterus annectens]|uniref:T-cell surface glycoprotein CD4-like isoform X2 n=1 Tax=Protopterus annectens TaxID=7888 RepID=UPI001CFA53CC|nr:T-cell surface glycoprotein CD4-like isoform X2 [Protopterus annectens]
MLIILGFVLTSWLAGKVHSAPKLDVYAMVGSKAILPCFWLKVDYNQVTTYRKLSVLWRRKTLQSRGDFSTVLSVENSGLVKKGLVVLDRTFILESHFHTGNYSLRIEPVKMEDAGTYICRVDYGSESIQQEVQLHLMRVLPSLQRSPREGDSLMLTCEITGELPQGIMLQWYHEKMQIVDNDQYWSTGTNKEKLSIRDLRSSYSGQWSCQLKQENRVTEAVYMLDVIGFLNPVSQEVTICAGVGSVVELPCHVNDREPSIISGWTRQGLQVEPLQSRMNWNTDSRITIKEEGRGDLTMTISQVLESDSGIYSCFLQLPEKRMQRNIVLVVAKVSASISGMVKEGSSLKLVCDPDEVTGGDGFEWTHTEVISAADVLPTWQSANLQSKTSYWGKTLTLKPVSYTDAGIWMCSVSKGGKRIGHIDYNLEISGSLLGDKTSEVTGKVLTAVIFSLIIVLLVVLLLLIAQRRRQRPREFPALENAIKLPPVTKEVFRKGQSSKMNPEKPCEMC